MLSEYSLLPPHWRQCQDAFGNTYYFNEITQEESEVHPYEKFLEASKTISTEKTTSSSRPNTRGGSRSQSRSPSEFFKDVLGRASGSSESRDNQRQEPLSLDSEKSSQDLLQIEYPPASPSTNVLLSPNPFEVTEDTNVRSRATSARGSRGIKYDYHCQWNERDVFGKVTLYGLTIRFLENGDTLLKFDGIDGEWTFTSLKGPYGCLEMHDLFIGAKVTVFGRHLTISSANAAACNWIHEQATKLQKQQNDFRKKIESIGEVPCIRKKDIATIKHITRNTKTIGQTNLRQLMKENARLGEQLANLGLAQQI